MTSIQCLEAEKEEKSWKREKKYMCKVITKSRKKDWSSVKAEKEGKGRKKEKHTHA